MSVDDSISSVNDEIDKITQLPNEIYDLALKEIIQNNLNGDDYEIAYSAGSGKGDNYIGIVYRVEVKSKNKNLNIIAKLPPQDLARREQFFVRPCFLRESQFYDDVQPIYKKFQEDKGIDLEKEGFNQIPFCYKSMTEAPNEALFFEDLKSTGFEMYDRFEDLTKDHVLLTMQVLGKMHAVFYAIKDQQPELIAEFREIVDIFMQRRDDPNMSVWFDSMKNQARSSIDNCDKAIIEKVENLFKGSFYELLSSCISGEDAEPYSILCHGDVSLHFLLKLKLFLYFSQCWNNNMMYRYDEVKYSYKYFRFLFTIRLLARFGFESVIIFSRAASIFLESSFKIISCISIRTRNLIVESIIAR